MHVIDSVETAQAWRSSIDQHVRVGLVPTMGALHRGHARCIESCSQDTDITVVSIFVNRSQFGDPKDYATYPRTWDDDVAIARESGASVVFAPHDDEMSALMTANPRRAGQLSTLWEGRHRPGHFDAVVTVVNQLFSLIRPNRARFGEKDRQQLAVIRDWSSVEWPFISIDAEPTVREPDGLAMSSRNVRLTPTTRKDACTLYQVLTLMKQKVERGERSTRSLINDCVPHLSSAFELDYLDVVDPVSFRALPRVQDGAVAIAAATIDGVRLIDNVTL